MSQSRSSIAIRASGWICFVVGLLVFTGWVFDWDPIKRVMPGMVMMKVNTALCFIFLGAGLINIGHHAKAVRLLSLLIVLLAGLSLFEGVTGISVGIDQMLFVDDDATMLGAPPGRMSVASSIGFLLSATVLWLLNEREKREVRPFLLGWLGSVIFILGFFSTLTTMASGFRGFGWEVWTSMSIHSALLFITVGNALLWTAWTESPLQLRRAGWFTLGFMGGLVLLALIAAAASSNNRERIRLSREIEETYRYLRGLNELESSINDVDRVLHSSFLTGDQIALLREQVLEFRERFHDLQTMAGLNSHPEMKLLGEDAAHFRNLIMEFSSGYQTLDPNARRLQVDAADSLSHRMHSRISQLRRSEHSDLNRLASSSEKSARRAMFYLPLSTFSSLVLLTSAFFLLHIEIMGRQKALENLRWSEERFRTLANLIPQLAWVSDAQGNVNWYNQRWYDYTGCTPGQMFSQGWQPLIEPQLLPYVTEGWNNSIKNGVPYEAEIAIRGADNKYRRFLTRAMPLRSHSGEIIQWFGSNTDIEDHKRAMSELQRKEFELRLSQQLGHIGTFDWDIVNNVIEWSPELEALYGLAPGSFGGRYDSWCAQVHPDDLPKAERAIKQSFESSSFVGEWRTIWPDGSIRWIGARASITKNQDGKPQHMIGANYDITELKAAEEQIRRLNADLEKRVELRTLQLQAANQELEAFSYSVSHDLRAPLRAIDGFSRMLLEDHAAGLDPNGKRMLGVLRTESQRMAQLIDDLLAFSRLGRQAIERKPVDMQALAHSAMEEIMSRNLERHIEFKIEPLPPAEVETSMFRQVWLNLLDNAVKFSRESPSPEVKIGSHETPEEQVYCVKDNGVGFDMKFSGKLFSVFQRLHNQQDFEGTGVGLALVKRIVQRHGGRVWAESQLGQGATFYFALPKKV